MNKDEFEMSRDFVRQVVVDENFRVHFDRYAESPWTRLDDCPRIVFEGREYAVVGPVDEVTFKSEKVPRCCRHSYRVLAVPTVMAPESDGRLFCDCLRCDKTGSGSWRASMTLGSFYTDEEDTEEYASHPVWNPETGCLERSTEPYPEFAE